MRKKNKTLGVCQKVCDRDKQRVSLRKILTEFSDSKLSCATWRSHLKFEFFRSTCFVISFKMSKLSQIKKLWQKSFKHCCGLIIKPGKSGECGNWLSTSIVLFLWPDIVWVMKFIWNNSYLYCGCRWKWNVIIVVNFPM